LYKDNNNNNIIIKRKPTNDIEIFNDQKQSDDIIKVLPEYHKSFNNNIILIGPTNRSRKRYNNNKDNNNIKVGPGYRMVDDSYYFESFRLTNDWQNLNNINNNNTMMTDHKKINAGPGFNNQ
jgi:hypothetical protein